MTATDKAIDQIAACLQARLSWPSAEGCAADVVRLLTHKPELLAALMAEHTDAPILFEGTQMPGGAR